MSIEGISYWVLKTEPKTFSIENLKEKKESIWDGVRNHQAKNFLKSMNVGD